MTVLRLDPIGGTGIESALALVETAVLTRRPDGAFAEIDDRYVARFTEALAFGGIAARASTVALAPPSGTRIAIGEDLARLPVGLVALDVLTVRRVPLGEATRELLVRSWPWSRGSNARRDRCRALVRGTDVAFAWARRAWATAAALRTCDARASLRPVVFAGVASDATERRAYLRDAVIRRWLF